MLDSNREVPEPYLANTRQPLEEFLHTLMEEVSLHGDLHHGNILQNETNWLAIDPQGEMG